MKFFKKFIIVLISLFIILLIFLRVFIAFYPVSYDTDGYSNLGVVFGAGITKSSDPSLALKFRLDKSIELYHTQKIKNIFVSGQSPEAFVMKNYLLKNNVPLSNIIVDDKGETTFITIKNVKKYMINNNISDSAVFISQKYHIPRISFIAHKMNLTNVHYIASEPNKINFMEETFTNIREAIAWLKNLLFDSEI